MEKTMILKFTDDAYFYNFGEQSRINEVLYEIRETINKNFKQYPFVKGISYYLNRNENNYEYVATITYEADDEPKKPMVEKNRTFSASVRKMPYENYGEVFEANRKLIEKQMYGEVDSFFSKHPDYKIISKEAKWFEEEDSNSFYIYVTYKAPFDAEDEE